MKTVILFVLMFIGAQASGDSSSSSDSDGTGCSSSDFQCSDGGCVPSTYVCDGVYDCDDGSDEVGCGCDSGEFTCNSGICIPSSWLCNGYNDCVDFSDELFCNFYALKSCNGTEFACSNGQCIPNHLRCDGADDCGDNSDEVGCSAASPTTCTYSISRNQVTCGTVACSTKNVTGTTPIPTGSYRIGEVTREGTWFHLHPQKHDQTGYWDYHSYNPDNECRGGFAIHRAGISAGFIVPETTGCFDLLKAQLVHSNPLQLMDTHTCTKDDCQPGSCSHDILWGSRAYYTDLTVVE